MIPRRRCLALLLPAAAALAAAPGAAGAAAGAAPGRGAFAFAFADIDGAPLPLERFAGRAMLVVNTASLCGFTYQYAALQEVWERYRDRGLVVLGVPSGDFGGQELGSGAEIKEFCEARFDLDFPMTEKVRVRGEGAHPLFAWLGRELGPAAAPRWNFTKYLIAPDGRALASWPSTVEPTSAEVRAAIERALPPKA